MAKSVDAKVTLSYLEDSESRDALVKQLTVALDVGVIRDEFVIAGGGSETDYMPPGLSQYDFLMIYTDEEITFRAISATGTAFKIPAGGVFLIMTNTAANVNIAITPHASNDANVIIWVGEA
jgi:hypothetical protein